MQALCKSSLSDSRLFKSHFSFKQRRVQQADEKTVSESTEMKCL